MKKILVVVDCQNDFCEPILKKGGALAVKGGLKVCESISQNLINDNYNKLVVTFDWHPSNHSSFKEYGGQWPEHCVQGSYGAALNQNIKKAFDVWEKDKEIFRKGINPATEEYGAEIRTKGEVQVDVVGIALDYCVKETAKMIKSYNPKANVRILKDYCATIGELDLNEMNQLGIEVV